MVRGRGYLRGSADIEQLVVKSDKGTPVLIRDIARVELGPDERRGLAELNGEGEVVSGIAMARYGQNALEVIHNLKAKIEEVKSGLPEGVEIVTIYDRSDLIHRAIDTLKRTLIEESLIVAAGVHRLPAARAQRAGGDPDAAGRHPDRVHRHAPPGHELQHHEPGRHRHRHRRDDRRRDRDDRERAQASRAPAAGRIADAGDDRRLPRGGAGALLLAAHHHRVVPAGVQPRRPGGAPVLAAGLHQDLRDGRRRVAVGDAGAGADDAVHPRQGHAGGEEPGQSLPDLGLPADHRHGDALQGRHHPSRRRGAGRHCVAGDRASAPSSCRR